MRQSLLTFSIAGAIVLSASAALSADKISMPEAEQKHYQVYFGAGDDTGPAEGATVGGRWGALRLHERDPGSLWDGLHNPLTTRLSGSGLTYITPSVSGLRMGIGVSSDAAARPGVRLGPRRQPSAGAPQHWQFGGSVGNSALQIGANMGDHPAPVCDSGTGCTTNDFWDIGVAIRIGPGSLSAAYLASQPRVPRADEVDRIDILSLNAGYQLAPHVNIYGGIDWVEVRRPGEAEETPLDTRFMFGTSLRF